MEPFRLSALELVAAYRSRKLSPVEAMKSVIGRVEAFEPHIAATWLYAPERALKEARASEARWMRAEPVGPLDGVPATVKDNIHTKGEPTPVGTAASDLTPAEADAPPAARLRQAGAILFGKTTMPDYGMLSSGLSSHHPLARNPWKLDRNPGGSSAGAGAAAAALYGPCHVGTDIGGSIRLPAGWCGVMGFKPSAGRVPIDPPYMGRVAGPMTRSVADAALMMATLSLPDARDYTSLAYEALDWAIRPASLAGLKVGLMLEAGCGAPPSAEVRAAVERAAGDLAVAGAQVAPVAPFLTQEMLDGLDHFWRTRALIDLNLLSPEKRASVLPFIRDWAEFGGRFFGTARLSRLQPNPGDAAGGGGRDAGVRRRADADRADDRFSRGMGLAEQEPARPVPAHRLHRRLQHVRAAGGVGPVRLLGGGPADRAADRRTAVRRRRRAFGGDGLRGRPLGRDAAVAGAAVSHSSFFRNRGCEWIARAPIFADVPSALEPNRLR